MTLAVPQKGTDHTDFLSPAHAAAVARAAALRARSEFARRADDATIEAVRRLTSHSGIEI